MKMSMSKEKYSQTQSCTPIEGFGFQSQSEVPSISSSGSYKARVAVYDRFKQYMDSIAPPQHTKMGPQRRLEIYVGFDSPSIIKYLESLMGDVFIARFAYWHFNETKFSTLEGGIKMLKKEITWNVSLLSHLDPYTDQCELEV